MSRRIITPDLEAAAKTFRLLTRCPGDVREVRLLGATRETQFGMGRPETLSGYFDSSASLKEALSTVAAAKGWYITLNPVHPDALSRASNCLIRAESGALTKAQEILRRDWLPVDIDPKRISGVSSSDAEHEQARALALEIARDLHRRGFPEALCADSGNGAHLLFPLELSDANDDLVKRFLESLAQQYRREGLIVDTAVHDRNRIWKLYGTPACKGDNTQERPYRLSRVLSVPETTELADARLLSTAVADWGPVHSTLEVRWDGPNQKALGGTSVSEVMSGHFPSAVPVIKKDGARTWTIDCPWCKKSGKAFVVEFPDGNGHHGCHSTGCQAHGRKGKGWNELLDKLGIRSAPKERNWTPSMMSAMGTVAGALRCYSWGELDSLPDSGPEYVMDGMVPKGYPGLLAAPPGLGKTQLVLHLMVAKAVGLPLFGRDVAEPAPCVLVEFEQSPRSLKRRVRSIIRQHGATWTDEHEGLLKKNLKVVVLNPPEEGTSISAVESGFEDIVRNLEAIVRPLDGLSWVVVDTLAWVSAGAAETDHLASRPLWSAALQFCSRYGCALTFVHHTRKAGKESKLVDRMSPEMVRGANSQEGNARVINQIGWLTGDELKSLGLPHGKNPTREYGVLALTKFNDGPLSE